MQSLVKLPRRIRLRRSEQDPLLSGFVPVVRATIVGFFYRSLPQARIVIQQPRGVGLRWDERIALGVIAVTNAGVVLAERSAARVMDAGAGVVDTGFGGQALVKDVISGIFIVFEDQYGVGDTVNLDGVVGVIEAVELRVTRVRDADGTLWY